MEEYNFTSSGSFIVICVSWSFGGLVIITFLFEYKLLF
ncbi:hypothetical protein LEP1GSC103_2962 [Leptospira borgpetersenii serovar Javanica str. UI 09931]|uniref:Uncharacterized protein n=5 Tax=Leptospira borgpetersenii TaxID=174 RepID=M3GY28_LEPBO|nr:hypothetical protein LEP1GSC128_3120 [Leptospira borgpetersenii str. 200801926]EMF99753.1 hypothetical protein LEP1GSC123_0068 [Leptospira borgpetersenii str. 200701203]EMK11715.1 hypothetical protein LEP1GSC066_0267 [Leptospira sp. serovar Kenya str. Sh9]EMN14287.1 hypothetical protein LEP1GSC055_2405 [Leptospira borgpetersenii str. Brem 307]EMN18445.1 hypothetical protein LEP1GSC056_2261 [Leptospira borgpetersenii str. Brem 328]EMO62595.1 hypothetical protein LEP1GSC133_1800 [Leptospira b